MLEEDVIGKKSVKSTGYRVNQAEFSDNTFLPIITKERTEGGLNKGAHLLPLYSSHFWFFRIEQYRGQYGVSIFPSSVN